MAEASGGEEGGDEDGEIVAGVEQGGAGDGLGDDADVGEEAGDAEEQGDGGPGVAELGGVETRRERTEVRNPEKKKEAVVRVVVERQRRMASGVRWRESQS